MHLNKIGLLAALTFLSLPAIADDNCKLQRYAELPVTMSGARPLVTGMINGKEAHFLADSGAFFSLLTNEGVKKFGLKPDYSTRLNVRGFGGDENAFSTTAHDFSLAGFLGGRVFHDIQFVVLGNKFAGMIDGIIGQNVLSGADTEYDLANGVIRLFSSKDCHGRNLAYWHGTANVAVVDIEATTKISHHIIGQAVLNNKKIRVVFDTGVTHSFLTLRAAKRAGIKPEMEGVSASGIIGGVGHDTHELWLARFDTLDIGGELIKNARLRMGEIEDTLNADMFLGADFFLSHRLYVSQNHRKIFFTYNGGAVFDLGNSNKDVQVADISKDTQSPSSQSTTSTDNLPSVTAGDMAESTKPKDAPLDADEFRLRGAALAGRLDFFGAIENFNQAIALDPSNAENFYQRGLAYSHSHQSMLAMNDFNSALKLHANHMPSLIERCRLRLENKDEGGARADFDLAISLVPGDASLQLRIAEIFHNFGYYDEAIKRFDEWISKNPKDERLWIALNTRCVSRAMLGKELDTALADCNLAMKRGPGNSMQLDTRAMVYLKLGNIDKSISDYKASLKLQPKGAYTLYGLGLAELRKGLKTEGEKNIETAKQIDPKVADIYSRANLTPQLMP